MTERLVEVVVDEALDEESGESCLKVGVYVDGEIDTRIAFERNASPQQISNHLYETGYLIKNERVAELAEEESQISGDIHIEASHNVPGLTK